jgi:deoxyribodipyrimidine photo-lyase
VPELAKLPPAALGDPWAHGDLLARLAPDYPRRPVVDLKQSRAEALAAYSGPKTLPPDEA